MIDLTIIIDAIIALVVALLTAFVLPWLRSKTTAEQRKELLSWVDIAVAAAQQLYHQCSGQQRLEYALSMLQEKGYDINDSVVVDAVEAAVLKLHQQLEASANVGV
jgi:uncharacterized membrane protein YraQ (UPF0718 family)